MLTEAVLMIMTANSLNAAALLSAMAWQAGLRASKRLGDSNDRAAGHQNIYPHAEGSGGRYNVAAATP